MKRHYWTPGWLIVGVFLLVISMFELVQMFLAGLWIGLWAAYPIIRDQHERGRKAGWAAGYEEARQEKA